MKKRKSKMKKKFYEFLDFFETEEDENSEYESLTSFEKIKLFFTTFRFQSFRYKIVWSVRILSWLILLVISIYGIYLKIKK